MFIDLGMRVRMTDEQFVEAMVERREVFDQSPNDHIIGCPLCLANIPLLEEEPTEGPPDAPAPGESDRSVPASGVGR
jgi:hypothetical protein